MKTINPQTQAQQTASTRNMKKNIPKTIAIKQWKTSDEEKNLKSNQREQKTSWEERNKDKDGSRFLVRNNVSKKTVESNL